MSAGLHGDGDKRKRKKGQMDQKVITLQRTEKKNSIYPAQRFFLHPMNFERPSETKKH